MLDAHLPEIKVTIEEPPIDDHPNVHYSFKYKVFFEIFLYHFLYIYCIGPLLIPFLWLFRGKHIIFNLSFWNFDRGFLFQISGFVSTFSIVFIYYYFQPSYLYFIEVYMILSAGIIRICIISIKYATMDQEKINEMFNKTLDLEIRKKEHTLEGWYHQKDESVNEELLRCAKNHPEDIPFFKMSFMGEISEKLEDDFKGAWNNIEKNIDEKDERNKIFQKYAFQGFSFLYPSQLKYYCGISIAKFILNKSNQEQRICQKFIFTISCIFSFIRTMMPIIQRNMDDKMFDLHYYDIWMIIMVTILNFYFFMKNSSFLIFGFIEFDRQYHYLSQISNLISAKKQEKYYTRKFYPTINFFDCVSLRSWSFIHHIFRNYGEKFKLRIVSYLSIYLIFYAFVIIFIITSFFLNDNLLSDLSYWVLLYEIGFVLISLLLVFRQGSAINEYYSLYMVLLRKNRSVLIDLLKFGEIYFDQEKYLPENPIYLKGVENIKKSIEDKTTPFLSLKGYKPKDNLKFKVRKEILKNLITTTDQVIEQLKYESMTYSFTICGVPMTDNVYKSILAIIGSILLAGLKKILLNKI